LDSWPLKYDFIGKCKVFAWRLVGRIWKIEVFSDCCGQDAREIVIIAVFAEE